MSETQNVELPKSMLILKSQPGSLGSVESFLKNRGWNIRSTSNLKEALVYILSQKPAFVAISIDHPNRKVRALPKIIGGSLQGTIIVFAESSSTSSYKALNEAGTDYRVYPPITGPAFERCVNKFLRDQATAEAVGSSDVIKNENNGNAKDSFSITISQAEKRERKKNGPVFEQESATKLFSQFLGEEGDLSSEMGTKSENLKSDNNLIFAQPVEEEHSENANSYIPSDTQKSRGPDPIIAGTSEDDDGSYLNPEGERLKAKNYLQKGNSTNGGTYVDPNDSLNGWGIAGEGVGAGENKIGHQGKTGSAHTGENSREENLQPSQKNQRQHIGVENGVQHIKSPVTRNDQGSNLIVQGTEKAIEESVEARDGSIEKKLEQNTSAACIVVESPRFSGYLVAVMAGNRKIDKEFIEIIKKRLFKFLIENGENVNDNNTMDIKIKQVEFEPWSIEYADFLRKSVHQGNEVAMAFFPRRPVKSIIEESHDKEMAKILLTDLQGDRQVEFDLYIYLPSNDKFVLYTPKGGVFYNKQLDRLKKQGVTHMHIPKNAIQEVSKYQAQNYLNDLVDDFEKKQEDGLIKKKAS